MFTLNVYNILNDIGQTHPLIQFLVNSSKEFVNKSKEFLEPLPSNQERPFPDTLNAAKYLIERNWVLQIPRSPSPTTVAEIRDKIRYRPHIRNMFSYNVRYPFSAFLHLVPALGLNECLSLLWQLIEQLSVMGLLYNVVSRFDPTAGTNLGEEIRQILTASPTEQIEIREELRPFIETSLNLLEQYWENSTYGLNIYNQVFLPQIIIQKLTPRVICPVPNEGLEIEITFPIQRINLGIGYGEDPFGQGGVPDPSNYISITPQMVISTIEHIKLIFSGGYTKSIEVIDTPIRVDSPLGFPISVDIEYYKTKIKPKTSINGTDPYIHHGPLNFLRPPRNHPPIKDTIEEYLTEVRKQFRITSRRFWLPWDTTENNLLWIGDPIMIFTPPEWLMENVGFYSTPIELWGAELLKSRVDNLDHPDEVIEKNHSHGEIWLPQDMYQGTIAVEDDTGEVRYPRRYFIDIEARNRCGQVNERYESGVTYPVQIRYLGYEVGQTISSGSVSIYSNLNHRPAAGHYSTSGNVVWYPEIPLVKGKPTWVRIFAEHDAPPPYFCPTFEEEHLSIFDRLDVRLNYRITRVQDGQTIAGNLSAFIGYEGVLEDYTGNKFHSMRTRSPIPSYTQRIGFFTIPLAGLFDMNVGGTFHLTGTLDFSQQLKNDWGLHQPSVPLNFSFLVGDPRYVHIHWLQVIPGTNTTGHPIQLEEITILEEWLQAIVPSVQFSFSFDGWIQIGQPGKTCDEIFSKIENKQNGRNGFWIALIDPVLLNQCDSETCSGWDGVSDGFGNRRAIARFIRDNSALFTARTIAHEFGHAHPHEFQHICSPGCANAEDCMTGLYYWKPGLNVLYPHGSCGENLFIPAEGSSAGFGDWRYPDYSTEIIISAEETRDIMTYCGNNVKGFELWKLGLLKDYFSDL